MAVVKLTTVQDFPVVMTDTGRSIGQHIDEILSDFSHSFVKAVELVLDDPNEQALTIDRAKRTTGKVIK